MSDVIITVSNLGKKYRLQHQRQGQRYVALRDVIAQKLKAPFQFLRKTTRPQTTDHSPAVDGPLSRSPVVSSPSTEDFWALKDVSFEVKRGEVVGIIGRNGAGKSTLLKILSRITEPTEGRVRIKGRVASLLEVGTGFHPELTGRENVFLNGAILGMHRAEIKRKFDEIVAFAEVEKFLDTPVKRYSSGMYVRLAFAVAAHLEPEILIVDEVLAVGDSQFQKKCLGKMEQVGRQGRTVLFVSHQIPSVTRLCQRAIWLESGAIKEHGPATELCSRYLSGGATGSTHREWNERERAPGNQWVRLKSVTARSEGGIDGYFKISRAVEISLTYLVLAPGKVLIPNVHFYSSDGTLIFVSHDWFSGWRNKPRPAGNYRTTFTVPGNFFTEGLTTVKVAISTYDPFQVHFEEPDAVGFTIVEDPDGTTSRGDYFGHLPGIVRPIIPVSTESLR